MKINGKFETNGSYLGEIKMHIYEKPKNVVEKLKLKTKRLKYFTSKIFIHRHVCRCVWIFE